MPTQKPMFFGAVRRGNAYVSLQLMPVYISRHLRPRISPELKKRRPGKPWFNFETTVAPLFKELARLIQAGFA